MKNKRYKIWLPTFLGCLLVLLSFTILLRAEPSNRQAMTGKGENAYKTVLLAGVDEAGENTDMLMLCTLDKEKGSLSILQIPRDTYYRTPNDSGKINRIYHSNSSKHGKKRAAEALAEEIAAALGVKIDGFVIFDEKTVESTVSLLGGVTVKVPHDISWYDSASGETKIITRGVQRLNGKEAVAFVRHRKSYAEGDLGRLDAQMRFVSGVMRALPNVKKIDALVTIYQEILPNLLTNLMEKDIMEVMIAYFKNRKDFSVQLMRLPGEACYDGGRWYYVSYREATERMLREIFFGGASFDVEGRFTDLSREAINNIYTCPQKGYRVYTPSEADDKNILGT